MNVDDGWKTVELDQSRAVDPLLFGVTLGEDTDFRQGDIQRRPISIRIGRRPTARNLVALYERGGMSIPPSLSVLTTDDLWLISFSVGVTDEGGIGSLRRLTFELQYGDDTPISVLDVMPRTELVRPVSGSLIFDANVSMGGEVSVPTVPQLETEIASVEVETSAGLKVRAGVGVRLSFSVVTPHIQAIGLHDNGSTWTFHRGDRPLLGDHLVMQTVRTSRGLSQIECQARISATIRTLSDLLPAALVGEWVPLTIPLNA